MPSSASSGPDTDAYSTWQEGQHCAHLSSRWVAKTIRIRKHQMLSDGLHMPANMGLLDNSAEAWDRNLNAQFRVHWESLEHVGRCACNTANYIAVQMQHQASLDANKQIESFALIKFICNACRSLIYVTGGIRKHHRLLNEDILNLPFGNVMQIYELHVSFFNNNSNHWALQFYGDVNAAHQIPWHVRIFLHFGRAMPKSHLHWHTKNELFGLKLSNTSSDNGSQKFVDFDGKQCNKLALFAWKSPIFMSSSKRIAFCERPGASVANGAQNGPSGHVQMHSGRGLLSCFPQYAVQSHLSCSLPLPFITKTRLQKHKNNSSNTKEKTRRSWNLLPDPDFLAQCVTGFQQNFAK